MYTDMKTILANAAANHYAVIATSPINLEMARGMVLAASEKNAPVIFLFGQNMMRRHAKAELLIPMIKKLAEYATVPIATCLDHGNDDERVMYAFRNGFTSIMYDGSLLPMEENIAKTKAYADLCHQFGMGIEGELGHVGIAMNGDDKKGIYTDPKDAANFVRRTGVDCIAIAVGTAHGDYPAGIIPHINFDCIKACKDSTGGMPIALHGGSGSGDENIMKAVEAGINKVNVVTDMFSACRNELISQLKANPKMDYIQLMMEEENAVKKALEHWIDLTGSAGKASLFKPVNKIGLLTSKCAIGQTE